LEIPTKFVEKAKFVKVIFTDVDREYDTLLHLFTLGQDWTWRRRMLSNVRVDRARHILDLACGTGLVTFALSRLMKSQGLVIGLDPSTSMLRTAIRNKQTVKAGCAIEFVQAVGEFMPFRDEVFEYQTVGLALRNFGDKSAMFREAHRTLIRSGSFLSVDFVVPDMLLVRKLYVFHIFRVLPRLGRLVSNNWHRTLTYLANSIQMSESPSEICKALSEQGFRRTFSQKITLGIVALVGGEK
jgi:demethylmenaquinone methyltransferase/2-methoxy-6-polyprenyl-1,4-benzoquinol methylase